MSPRAALNFVRQLLDRRERAERREQTISDHALLALLSASYYEP